MNENVGFHIHWKDQICVYYQTSVVSHPLPSLLALTANVQLSNRQRARKHE